MQITHERVGDSIVVHIQDEMGHHEARRILDYLENIVVLYPVEPVVLDLSGLTFMDSSGLAVAMNLHRALARTGRSLVIRGTPPQAMRVFRAAGLPHRMTFVDEKGEKQC
ncbi:STAS domain-containing protein [Intestinibacillus sp. Marseille-P6563]|uniref:STAS domain-containing protein n=1 Tax=Intestinibacillus sp. Marseille-P6563 TaxID=2364792 RepID=UPI000F04E593|nr:STAS domain-containing protein [Intestinibacillus sp. Marseille-P6563]